MFIQFIKSYTVKDGIGTHYEIGDVLKCNEGTAAHFINRGAAVETTAKEPAKKPAKATAKEKAVAPK